MRLGVTGLPFSRHLWWSVWEFFCLLIFMISVSWWQSLHFKKGSPAIPLSSHVLQLN